MKLKMFQEAKEIVSQKCLSTEWEKNLSGRGMISKLDRELKEKKSNNNTIKITMGRVTKQRVLKKKYK